MDRLDAMSVLLAVVEAGSLSGAGRKLGLPLSTVSRKVGDLETHLGARLLVRSNRKVSLTDAGRSYTAASKRILAEVSDAERAAAGEYSSVRGELVITAPVVFGRLHVLPVVAAFLQANPEITIRLVLADRIVHLVEDHVDLALRIGTLPDSSLSAVRLGAIRRVVCASPGYLSRRGRPMVPEDLAQHDCVTFTGTRCLRQLAFPGRHAGTRRADPLSACRKYGRGGDRCGDHRAWADTGALLSDCGCPAFSTDRDGP